LQTVLTHVDNLDIVKGPKSVEVRPMGMHKGLACFLIMEKFKYLLHGYPDFVLCLGGTQRDEDMFNRLNLLGREHGTHEVNRAFRTQIYHPLI